MGDGRWAMTDVTDGQAEVLNVHLLLNGRWAMTDVTDGTDGQTDRRTDGQTEVLNQTNKQTGRNISTDIQLKKNFQVKRVSEFLHPFLFK